MIDTCGRRPFLLEFGMPFIVTMEVESYLVGKRVVCVISIQVIDLNVVPISEGQFAPSTFSLLLVQKFAKRGSSQWVTL